MNRRKSRVSFKRWSTKILDRFSSLTYNIIVSFNKAEQFRLTRFQDKSKEDVFLGKIDWTRTRLLTMNNISKCVLLRPETCWLVADAGIEKV